jgi:hypothetical protein
MGKRDETSGKKTTEVKTMRNPFRVRRTRQSTDENLPPGYPAAYAQQEAQVLQQISARRRAFMERAGQAEQQFTGAAPQQTEMVQKSSVPSASGEQKAVEDLFEGDVLG